MKLIDANKIDKQIVCSRQNDVLIENTSLALLSDLTVEDAYELQKKVMHGIDRSVIGWKLGGTNLKTRQIFNVDKLYWGPIFDLGVVTNCNPSLPSGELEVAVKFGRDITEFCGKKSIDLKDIPTVIDSVALSIEFPSTVFESFGDAGVVALVSDCCASGQVCIGEEISFEDYVEGEEIQLFVNGVMEQSTSDKVLIDGVAKTVLDFINLSCARGFSLCEGQWVFTGGITPLIRFSSGSEVEVKSSIFPSLKFKSG